MDAGSWKRVSAALRLTVLIVAALTVTTVPIHAQDSSSGSLRMTVKVQSVQAPGETQASLRWVVVDLNGVQIDVQDAELLSAIAASLQEMNRENHPWVARGTAWNFFGKLSTLVSSKVSGTFELSPPSDVLKPATELNKESNAPWVISYAPAVIHSFAIVVTTAEAQKPGASAIKQTKTLADAAAVFATGSLTDLETRIPVTISYAASDLTAGPQESPDAAKQAVETSLLKIAANSFVAGKTGGFVINKPLPKTRSTIEDRLNDFYSTAKIKDWGPGPKATIRQTAAGSGDWIMTVGNVRPLGSVLIRVEPIKLQQELKDKGQTADALKLEKRRAEIEAAYIKRYGPKLQSRSHEVPVRAEIEKDAGLLAQADDALSVMPIADGSNLIYAVTRRPQIASLSLKAGIGYNPEDSFTGLAQISETNLLHWNEVLSFSFSGGNQILSGLLSFSAFCGQPQTTQYSKCLTVSGKLFRDRDQQLGNPTGPQLQNNEASAEAKFSAGYDSFTPRDHILRAEGFDKNRKRLRYTVRGDASFNYKDASIDSFAAGSAPVSAGRVSSISLVIDQGISYDLRRTTQTKLGEFDFFVTATAKKAFDSLGGEFSFEQYSINLGSQLFFGPRTPTDIFLRFSGETGVSSRTTPAFELFRLGGPNNVRGLEEGEFIGRNLNLERAEIGFKSTYLLGLFKAKRDAGSNTAQPVVGGIDLSNTYLKTFYDWGRVGDQRSSNPFDITSGVQGLGFAIELRGLNVGGKRASLSIGYAYSHDSLLHKSGVLVTSFSLDR